VPEQVTYDADDEQDVLDLWDSTLPDYRGLLNAEVVEHVDE
jgi:hypothetical protein